MSQHEFFRQIFSQSRLAEFASKEGLERQTGNPVRIWPLAILKELVDNSLDACEGAGIAPEIAITITDEGITIEDNGPGMEPKTVKRILDFDRRTSSNAVYVAPTRGQQGNALQTLLAMPFAASGKPASTTIASRGVEHTITFDIDPITREPVITHEREDSPVESGTRIFVPWTEPIAYGAIHRQVASYQWFNPHMTVHFKWTRLSGYGDEDEAAEDGDLMAGVLDDMIGSLLKGGACNESFEASDPIGANGCRAILRP